MRWLKRLLPARRTQESAPVFTNDLEVAEPAYLIGDIHGAMGQLANLMRVIRRQPDGAPEARLVFLGDYVDRGENSADVLRFLFDLSRDPGVRTHFLMGNHERMMLDFLLSPAKNGPFWLRNGGLQTLASFAIGGLTETASSESLERAAEKFGESLSPDILNWLTQLPLIYRNGNLTAVHAAADPRVSIEAQSDQVLLWGNQDFFGVRRQDGHWIAHGHSIVDQAGAESGRISVDTGAYFTGILSAAYVAPGAGPRFFNSSAAHDTKQPD